jgi:hypothetical protein
MKEKQCTYCNKTFTPYHTSVKLCSDECKKKSAFDARWKTTIERSRISFPDGMDKDEYVECGVCGFRTRDLAEHPKVHGLTQLEYREKYGPIVCVSKCNRIKGDKNPAYQHGGRLSPFSKKFVKYEELTDEEKLSSIGSVIERAKTTMSENDNYNTTIQYYTKQGYSEEESLKLLSERQSTFSLDKCVEKHGMLEGFLIWQERQDKWQNTLNSRPQEEIDDANRRKDSCSLEWALSKTNGDEDKAFELFKSRNVETKINYKSLWNRELTDDGYFYVVGFDDKIKIGITSRDSIYKRYTKQLIDTSNVVLFQKMEDINHAFQTEQLLKRKYKHLIRKDDYGEFGWTEVLNDANLETLMEEVRFYIDNPEHVYKTFDITFKGIDNG